MSAGGRFMWDVREPTSSAPAIDSVETPLGWFGAAGVVLRPHGQWCVVGVMIGHDNRRSCLAALQAAVRNALGRTPRSPRSDAAERGCAAVCQRLLRYARGEACDTFADLWVWAAGASPFRRRVLELVRAIPPGGMRTYGQIASAAGFPKAARAVGAVMRSNRVPIVVPCHRVVGRGGRLTGFTAPAGVELKQRLLALERRGSASASTCAEGDAAGARATGSAI